MSLGSVEILFLAVMFIICGTVVWLVIRDDFRRKDKVRTTSVCHFIDTVEGYIKRVSKVKDHSVSRTGAGKVTLTFDDGKVRKFNVKDIIVRNVIDVMKGESPIVSYPRDDKFDKLQSIITRLKAEQSYDRKMYDENLINQVNTLLEVKKSGYGKYKEDE